MVLAIVGSSRKGGNTDILTEQVLFGVKKQGIITEKIYLSDFSIKDCIGCEGCKKTFSCIIQDDMQKIYPLIDKAEALILASPTYFYNVTGLMKFFLDRLYCYDLFDENDRSVWISKNELSAIKYAVTIAVCEQDKEDDMGFTSLTLNKTLEAVGYRITDSVKVLNAFIKGSVNNRQEDLSAALSAGERLGKTLNLRKSVFPHP